MRDTITLAWLHSAFSLSVRRKKLQEKVGSSGHFTAPPHPTTPPPISSFDLWLLLLPANSFFSLFHQQQQIPQIHKALCYLTLANLFITNLNSICVEKRRSWKTDNWLKTTTGRLSEYSSGLGMKKLLNVHKCFQKSDYKCFMLEDESAGMTIEAFSGSFVMVNGFWENAIRWWRLKPLSSKVQGRIRHTHYYRLRVSSHKRLKKCRFFKKI